MRFSSLLVAGAAASVSAQSSSFTPLRPPAIPLAVKSPYMNTWQQAGGPANGGYLAGQWPTFWQGQVTGWTGRKMKSFQNPLLIHLLRNDTRG